ncbi:glycosyltransferase [Parapusillimonas sp. SGNA-6]|nr:glycosyltransferase [Parapusillimonas sp. SGNA-6]
MMAATTPRVSVVVPTYLRPDLLERCLSALLRQSLAPEAYEIIICDDGPSKAVRDVVVAARTGSGDGPAIRYIPVEGTQGPAGARNQGWRAAQAPIVAFTDDDTIPAPGWLEGGLEAMSTGADAAVGRIQMPLPPRPTDVERDAARLTEAEFVTANCFVRRDALQRVGGFDERFTLAWREDSDLHFSLLERGCLVVKAPGALVVHPPRPAPFAASLGMQKKVMFDVLLYRKYPDLYRQRIRRRPPWFYLAVSLSLLLGVCAALAGWHRLAVAGLGAWLLLSLLFFVWRLRLSAVTPRNVIELLLTSPLIPPLSMFWRAVGATRFGWVLP